jgi:dTDP-4-dehydrorhamnose reductase
MKKVLILGATGMLGSALYDVLQHRYELLLGIRDISKLDLLERTYGGTARHCALELDATRFVDPDYYRDLLAQIGSVDHVVNAIGITASLAEKDTQQTYFINGNLPHILAETFGSKMIHIATDGVYDGKKGPYDESSEKSPVGVYAESKSRGEPATCLTLRTSIIGRELERKEGLLEWLLRQGGTNVTGYRKHLWNGITAKEFAHVCDRIMLDPGRFPDSGVYHIFSTTVSKYDMLVAFREKFHIDCEIIPDDAQALDRTLSTIYSLNNDLNIPSFAEMLAQI